MYPNYEVKIVSKWPERICNLVWSNDSQSLIVASGEGHYKNISRIDISSKHVLELLRLMPFHTMSSSPAETVLAITTLTDVTLFNYEGDKGTRILAPHFSVDFWAPVWSHDGQRVAFPIIRSTDDSFTRMENVLYVVSADGSKQIHKADSRQLKRVTWAGGDEMLSVEFPHQEAIIVSSDQLKYVYTYDLSDKIEFTYGPQRNQACW